MSLFRDGLLDGRSIAIAGAVPDAVPQRLDELGGSVALLEETDEDRALERAQDAAPIDVLVCGASQLSSIDQLWVAVRAVANGALIPAEAGAIVLLGPRPGTVEHAEAVRVAVENLARTLSIEWARYGLTATALMPGAQTSEDELASMVAYLCSLAGAYFSGCRFELA